MKSKHKDRFLFLVMSTRMGPAVVFALPIYLLAAGAGLIDTCAGIIAVYIVYNLAFGIWMMHGFFLTSPPRSKRLAWWTGGSMFAASTLGILPPVIFGIMARKWLGKGLSGGLVD